MTLEGGEPIVFCTCYVPRVIPLFVLAMFLGRAHFDKPALALKHRRCRAQSDLSYMAGQRLAVTYIVPRPRTKARFRSCCFNAMLVSKKLEPKNWVAELH